jgi:hypothetical protein
MLPFQGSDPTHFTLLDVTEGQIFLIGYIVLSDLDEFGHFRHSLGGSVALIESGGIRLKHFARENLEWLELAGTGSKSS